MTMPNAFTPKIIVIAVGGVLALGAGTWGISAHFKTPPKPEPVEPVKLFEAMRKPDLSDKERDELRHKMREAFEARMDARTDEYFNASEDERAVVLDQHIDEMLKEQEEREARRKERDEREGQPPPPEDPGAGPTSRPGRGPRDMTPQERKTRSETRNPDQMARRMAYFQAMQARMAARGIQPPHGPGGRGGPGGPRGFGGPRR